MKRFCPIQRRLGGGYSQIYGLEPLGSPSSTEAVQLEACAGNRQGLRLLSKLRSRFGRGNTRPQDVALASGLADRRVAELLDRCLQLSRQLDTLFAQGRTLLESEMQAIRDRLQQFVGRPDTREALFLSNPDFYRTSVLPYLAAPLNGPRPARSKVLGRKLMAYMQRFCAKNDTASFFGPMNTAEADTSLVEPMVIRRAQRPWLQREVFVSFWAVQALAETIGAEPWVRAELCPRLHPMVRKAAGTVYFDFAEKGLQLSQDQVRPLDLVDGTKTLRQIAEELGQPLA